MNYTLAYVEWEIYKETIKVQKTEQTKYHPDL